MLLALRCQVHRVVPLVHTIALVRRQRQQGSCSTQLTQGLHDAPSRPQHHGHAAATACASLMPWHHGSACITWRHCSHTTRSTCSMIRQDSFALLCCICPCAAAAPCTHCMRAQTSHGTHIVALLQRQCILPHLQPLSCHGAWHQHAIRTVMHHARTGAPGVWLMQPSPCGTCNSNHIASTRHGTCCLWPPHRTSGSEAAWPPPSHHQ